MKQLKGRPTYVHYFHAISCSAQFPVHAKKQAKSSPPPWFRTPKAVASFNKFEAQYFQECSVSSCSAFPGATPLGPVMPGGEIFLNPTGSFLGGSWINYGTPLPAIPFPYFASPANAITTSWILAIDPAIDGNYLKMVQLQTFVENFIGYVFTSAARYVDGFGIQTLDAATVNAAWATATTAPLADSAESPGYGISTLAVSYPNVVINGFTIPELSCIQLRDTVQPYSYCVPPLTIKPFISQLYAEIVANNGHLDQIPVLEQFIARFYMPGETELTSGWTASSSCQNKCLEPCMTCVIHSGMTHGACMPSLQKFKLAKMHSSRPYLDRWLFLYGGFIPLCVNGGAM